MTVNSDCQLADGRAVVVRPAGPGDVAAITKLYLELSAESFRRRFHAGRPAPALVARFARVGSDTVCFVAASHADPDCLAAEARYVPISAETAELALTVADGYQGAGIGHLLLEALVQQAREDGLKRLRAIVLLDNKPMLRLLQHYGWVLADATEDFVACLEISAVGGMPGSAGAVRRPAGAGGTARLVRRRAGQGAAFGGKGRAPVHRPAAGGGTSLPAGHVRAVPACRGGRANRKPAPGRRTGLRSRARGPPAALAASPFSEARWPATGEGIQMRTPMHAAPAARENPVVRTAACRGCSARPMPPNIPIAMPGPARWR